MGRSAVVTGGGRGIGRAIALGLAAAGADLVLVARSRPELEETADRVRERGVTARMVLTDLADPDQFADLAEHLRTAAAPVGVLINNAAVVSPLGATAAIDPLQWATALAVNVTAPAALTIAVLPRMLTARWGRIVNISSGIAAQPAGMVRANAYATTKAALEAHTLNLAAELAGTGVTVNAYRPGGVDTAMQAWIRRQDPEVVGAELHDRFHRSHSDGTLLTADASARGLLIRLTGETTGQIWDVSDPDPDPPLAAAPAGASTNRRSN